MSSAARLPATVNHVRKGERTLAARCPCIVGFFGLHESNEILGLHLKTSFK